MPQIDDRDPLKARKRLAALRPRLEQRARVLEVFRTELRGAGFLEVETPSRIRAPAPEQHIDAEPSGNRYLITSPELQMKRLLASGAYDKIFQICRCFRRGERGEHHLPEFTMVEWYRTRATTNELREDCRRLVTAAARALGVFPVVTRGGDRVVLTPPWDRMRVADLFEEHAGWRPGAEPDPDRFNRDMVLKVEPALPRGRPVFLDGYPAAMASLARLDPADRKRADRFELYAGGLELANGFSELTDATEQRRRFELENAAREAAGKRAYPLDERFLAALDQGLEPCAGIALGIDRLVMLLTEATTIDEVTAFPEGSA
jgi:lysyl-tRNA synthetase class 2